MSAVNKDWRKGATIPIWHPDISVGNAKLDEQHIVLLELGRNLLRLLQGPAARMDSILPALQDLYGLCCQHDLDEEEVLRNNACPTLDQHIESHQATQGKLARLLADASNNAFNEAELSQVITEWMAHHISENDLPVKQYLKVKPGSKPRPRRPNRLSFATVGV
ncbi:MAG: hemerythrin domain-containing protein [Burkholderiales bacterium]